MARGRMINKKISLSHKPNQLSCRAYALFCTMIAHLDVNGILPADPDFIKAAVVPRRKEQTKKSIKVDLNCMRDLKILVFFQVDFSTYVWFPGFRDEQPGLRADKERPQYPPPPQQDKQGHPSNGDAELSSLDGQKTEINRNVDGMSTEIGRNQDGTIPEKFPPKVKVKVKVNSLTGEVEGEGPLTPATASLIPEKEPIRPAQGEHQQLLQYFTELYEENIGTATPFIKKELSELATTCHPDYFAYAVNEAVDCNKRNLAYIEAIIERLEREGLPDALPPGVKPNEFKAKCQDLLAQQDTFLLNHPQPERLLPALQRRRQVLLEAHPFEGVRAIDIPP